MITVFFTLVPNIILETWNDIYILSFLNTNGTGSLNPSSWKTSSCLSLIIRTMFAHSLVTEAARTSVVMVQWKPDISRSCISRNWIYRGRMLDPIFCPPISQILQTWRPRARYFSLNRGNSLHSIRGRQFFAKSAHRDSLCSCSLETIFRQINLSLPVNAGWNTCCAMGSHARWSIDASIVSQSRVQLIQCQCKSRPRTANLGINNAFNQIVVVWPRCLHPPSCQSLRQFRSKSSVRDW